MLKVAQHDWSVLRDETGETGGVRDSLRALARKCSLDGSTSHISSRSGDRTALVGCSPSFPSEIDGSRGP